MTRHLFRKCIRGVILGLVAAVSATLTVPHATHAYSYALADNEPLLDGREALFQAADSGFWTAARIALQSMREDIDRIEQNAAPGVAKAFDDAVATKDVEALRAAFRRAAGAEISRRLNTARDNVFNYEVAKLEVAKANRFYIAVAADLDPEASRIIAEQIRLALDAIGTPGVLGVGFVPADRDAFDAARSAVFDALQNAEQ